MKQEKQAEEKSKQVLRQKERAPQRATESKKERESE